MFLMPYMSYGLQELHPAFRATDDPTIHDPQGSDGYYFGLKIGRKRVGHVGGIAKQASRLNDQGQYVPAYYFDVMNVSLDEDQGRQGLFQPALQQIADMFPDRIKSLKVQTSRGLHEGQAKDADVQEKDNNHVILSSRNSKATLVASS